MARVRVSPSADVSSADWVVEATPGFEGRAHDLVPGPFPAYVRIFHRPDQGIEAPGVASTWAEVAARRGTQLHEAAQWAPLSTPDPSLLEPDGVSEWWGEPLTGTLDLLTLSRLVEVLARHTSTREACWLALWVGHGSSPQEWWGSAPTLRAAGREHWLFGSSLPQVVEHCVAFATSAMADDDPWLPMSLEWGEVRSPQLWWPEDRAWAVASEIDHDSTIVGGSVALCAELVGTAGMESLRIDPRTSLHAGADQVNGT